MGMTLHGVMVTWYRELELDSDRGVGQAYSPICLYLINRETYGGIRTPIIRFCSGQLLNNLATDGRQSVFTDELLISVD